MRTITTGFLESLEDDDDFFGLGGKGFGNFEFSDQILFDDDEDEEEESTEHKTDNNLEEEKEESAEEQQ